MSDWNAFEHADLETEGLEQKPVWISAWSMETNELHFIPLDEQAEHIFSTQCKCKPDIQLVDESDRDKGYKVAHKILKENHA